MEQALEGITGFALSHEVDLQPTWAVEGAQARVDGDRFIQVVLNLISNAVKYSRVGDAVQLRLGRRGRRRFPRLVPSAPRPTARPRLLRRRRGPARPCPGARRKPASGPS